MRHCCKFRPDDIYYLEDTEHYTNRKLSIGFCPICQKPIAELTEWRFDGVFSRIAKSGFKANEFVNLHSNEIVYSLSELNYLRSKSKPFGWKYGVNKSYKNKDKNTEQIKQYAYDFYGNKELIKTI